MGKYCRTARSGPAVHRIDRSASTPWAAGQAPSAELLSYQNDHFGRERALRYRMTGSETLADLYFRLEQVNRTIKALERFAHLRAQRQARLQHMPAGLVRDVLTRRRRSTPRSYVRVR
jgi:hypothetical protein